MSEAKTPGDHLFEVFNKKRKAAPTRTPGRANDYLIAYAVLSEKGEKGLESLRGKNPEMVQAALTAWKKSGSKVDENSSKRFRELWQQYVVGGGHARV